MNGQLEMAVIDPALLLGRYANNVAVTFTENEIKMDFVYQDSSSGATTLVSRIIMPPRVFKRMAGFDNKIVADYEEKFGYIKETDLKIVSSMPPNIPRA